MCCSLMLAATMHPPRVQVPFGQQLVLVGDAPQLGAWDLGAAPLLSWSDGDVWHCSVELPAGAAVQYKFVQQIPHR